MSNLTNGPHQIAAQACRGDFWLMFQEALKAAGGNDDIDTWKNMPLEKVVEILAQNGLRMVHMPEKTIGSPDFPTGVVVDGPDIG